VLSLWLRLEASAHPEFSLRGGGGDGDTEAVYNLSDFKNCVTKIVSKSPNRHVVRSQGKFKLCEKENYVFVSSIYISQYSSVLVISRFQWLI
jgi:hypothetical protein